MIDEQLDQETVPAVETRRLLWGFLPFESALATLTHAKNMLDPLGLAKPLDQEELREEWENAQAAIEPADPPDDPEIKPIPDNPAIENHVSELQEQTFYQQTYGTDGKFALVPLEKLVALQGSVVVTAHQEVSELLDDPVSLYNYVFPLSREQGYFTQTIQTDGNELLGVQLTSRAPNVSISNVRMGEGERPMEKQVVFTVRAPPNLVNCILYNGRLYLNNGYHRAYQLLSAGETHIPAIIREVNNFPQDTGDLPRDVVESERPPLLTDFRSDAATDFRLPATNELIRITAESTKVFR